MIARVDATLVNGVLKPDQNLQLPDQSRVHLTIEAITAQTKSADAWTSILARLKLRPLHLGAKRITREELYDRG